MNASSNTLPQESSRRSDGIIRSLRNTHSVLGAVPPARRNVNDGEVSTIDHSIADQNWLQRLEELKKYKEEYGKVTGVKGSLSTTVIFLSKFHLYPGASSNIFKKKYLYSGRVVGSHS